MSKAQKDAVKSMKPSAYRSMLMGKLGMTSKSSPSKKKDLLRWGSPTKGEQWINLSAQLTDKKELPCGTKGKKQKEQGLPSVCRPKKKVNQKTPQLAKEYSTAQIKKAIEIKKKGKTIQWSKL
jgi:hypothetical protein